MTDRPGLLPGACDCHTHVFEAADDFPLAHPPSYAPPYAPAEMHRALQEANGLSRGVIVQPTPYGTDPRVMLRALRLAGGRLRGVGVATRNTDAATLEGMKAGGITALRFVENRLPDGSPYLGAVTLDELFEIAPVMRDLGWHAETWAPLATVIASSAKLERTGLPIVLDHMGGFNVDQGVAHAEFQRLLAMVREGLVWVKLVVCRRVPPGSDFEILRPFHDALIDANPDRMLWGTDWPFVRMDNPPEASTLLDLFHRWTGDAALRHRILVDNPRSRYGFD